MAANYHYMYHEYDEAREARERYNEVNTGDKGLVEEARVELPTAAGSVMLDLGQLSGGGSGGSSAVDAEQSVARSLSRKGASSQSTRSFTQAHTKSGRARSRRKHGDRDGDDDSFHDNPTGGRGVDARKVGFDASGQKLPSGNLSQTLFKNVHEDDVPPLTAEVRPPARCDDAQEGLPLGPPAWLPPVPASR